MYKNSLKPILDFSLALIGFILLLPVFLCVTILLFLANQGKPFFIQKRPGFNGEIFSIIKFKTMNDKKDRKGNLLTDAERLTAVGRFVRKTSLDEIPQLINVLKGDMSLVGPRPLLTQYMHLYSPFQNRRHEVKPGITGWAQINGRNAIDWETKFELDVFYVENISFGLDVKILLKTVKKIIIKEGINAQNSATIEPFSGTTSVYVFGAGGHGKVVLDVLMSENKYVVRGVLDDAPQSDNLFDIPIKKKIDRKKLQARNCIVAIGDNSIRKKIVTTLDTNFIMTIHPNAIVSKFAKIGPGTQIMAAAVVNTDAIIGKHCIINTGAIVEHDCKLEDFVHVAPNACLGGNVTIGEKTLIGIGATVIPNIKIGKNVSVGAGTVVLQDIPDNAVVVGIPARIVKYQEN